MYIIPLGGMILRQKVAIGGSGSTFIWGFADANYKEGMNKDECVEFVKRGKIPILLILLYIIVELFSAVTLALTRDNSSSGLVRLGIITEEGVERKVFLHNELENFNKI